MLQRYISVRLCLDVLQNTHSGVLSPLTSRAMSDVSGKKRIKRKATKQDKHSVKKFADFRQIRIKAGDGGDGMMSFLSLPKKEWAGPDGGDGGNGGHVLFQADNNIKSLNHLSSVNAAESGVGGRGNNMIGKNASHLLITVPIGTIIKDDTNRVIADLEDAKQLFVAARGGAGGKGNSFFLSNENRAPTEYEKGALGEEKTVYVELRMMAHVGLVGFPNAGKSTLLRAVSRARPKVASYPFTTLNPSVGMVEYDDLVQVAVADIPGLIPGAHLNYGLGVSFLRHIERCVCLLYVLDLAQDEPWRQLESLKFELEQYSPGLSERPHAIVANKLDVPMADKNLEELRQYVNMPVYAISAKNSTNIDMLLEHIRDLYNEHNTYPD